MELLEVVSETNVPTGIRLPRAEAIAKRAWCRSTNVFVLNAKGELLCHQRSLEKERLPGAWVTHVGGHVGAGESYEENAQKELEEEAGVLIDRSRFIHWRTTKHERSHLWMRDYVTLIDAPLDTFKPQPGEVERFRWMPIDEILREVALDPTAWCPGIHDVRSEYECMRSALVVAHNFGACEVPEHLRSWCPEPATI